MELKNFFAQDTKGNVVPFATVTVYHPGTTVRPTIYGVDENAITNPFNVGNTGLAQFRAANGEYDVKVITTDGEYMLTMQCNDVGDTVAAADDAAAAADRSGAEADRAEEARQGAESAQTGAEAARDAAQLSAGVYADTAAGLADTLEGDYFSTPSGASDEYLILYRHDSGPVATELERYPSTQAVDKVGGAANEALREARSVFGGDLFIIQAEHFVVEGYLETDGTFTPSTGGYLTTEFIPVRPGDSVTYVAVAGSTPLVFYDAAQAHLHNEPGTGNPPSVRTVTAPAGSAYVRMSHNSTTETDPYAKLVLPDAAADKIEAYDYIPHSELAVYKSSNRALAEYVREDQYVNNEGGISSGTGWVMLRIPVESDTDYTFGNFAIDTGGYSSFLDADNNVLQYNGALNTGTLPQTFRSPSVASDLCIDVARPTNVASDWELAIVNKGAELLPYEEPVDTVTAIDGKKLAGSVDPSEYARLGYDANFARLQADELEASALVTHLPSGTTMPAEVELNQAWIDEADGTIKVRLS